MHPGGGGGGGLVVVLVLVVVVVVGLIGVELELLLEEDWPPVAGSSTMAFPPHAVISVHKTASPARTVVPNNACKHLGCKCTRYWVPPKCHRCVDATMLATSTALPADSVTRRRVLEEGVEFDLAFGSALCSFERRAE